MLTRGELLQLVDDARPYVLNGRIQKIRAVSRERLKFSLFLDGAKHDLLWILDGPLPRVQLSFVSSEAIANPPPVFQQIRGHLLGGRVRSLELLPLDRIIRMDVEVRGDGTTERYAVVAELFRKHRNLYLLNRQDAIVSALAPLAEGVGLLSNYQPPTPKGSFAEDGLAPFSAVDRASALTLSEAVEIWARKEEEENQEDSLQVELLRELRKRHKKESQLVSALESDLAEASAAEELRHRAELLMQNIGALKKGDREAVVLDYSSTPPIEIRIPLDPLVTPLAYAQALFKDAKKRDRSLTKVAARLADAEERCRAVQSLLQQTEAASGAAELKSLRDRAVTLRFLANRPEPAVRTLTPSKPEPTRRKPTRTFRSPEGHEILVGRTAADNDELSLRIARGNDLWLHVGDYAGSHVVVRDTPDLPHATLLDAALLALHYSQAPKGAGGEVSYTKAKYVKKFKGARPGQVQLAERKSIRVRPDPERLQRLLQTGGDGPNA